MQNAPYDGPPDKIVKFIFVTSESHPHRSLRRCEATGAEVSFDWTSNIEIGKGELSSSSRFLITLALRLFGRAISIASQEELRRRLLGCTNVWTDIARWSLTRKVQLLNADETCRTE